jgi:CubicO group peptidase (beta-lactamase class C family)
MEQSLDEMLGGFCKNGDFVGLNVLAAKDGKVIYRGEAGTANLKTGRPVRADTIFHLYSMSKPVTSAAVLKLREEENWSFRTRFPVSCRHSAPKRCGKGTDWFPPNAK